MGRLRKVLVGAVAALATLAAGLVGVGTANAAPTAGNIVLKSADGSTLSGVFRAYRLVGYDNVQTSGTGTNEYVTSVTPVDVDNSPTSPATGVRSTINDALNHVGVSSSPATASHELLNMSSSSPKVPQIASFLASHIADLGSTNGSVTYPVTGQIASSDSKSVSFNVDDGLYLIVHGTVNSSTGVFTPDSAGADGAISPMILSSKINGLSRMGSATGSNGQDLGTANVKNGAEYKPTKTYTADGATASDGTSLTDPYVAVGDTAHFTIAMNIPDSASHQAFTLTDTPKGYTIDQSSIRFYHVPADTTADHYADFENKNVGKSNETNNNSHEIASVIHNPSGVTLPAGVNPIARYNTPLPGAITYPNLTWSGAVPASGHNGVADEGFTLTDHAFDILRNSSSPDATDSWINSHKNDSSIIRRFSGEKLIVTYDAVVDSVDAANSVNSHVWDYSGNSTPEPGNTTTNGGELGEPLLTFHKVAASNRTHMLGGVTFTLRNNSTGKLMAPGTPTRKTVGLDTITIPSWNPVNAPSSGDPSDAAHGLLTTETDGSIDLDGLTEGKYTLHEVGLPSSGDASHYLTPNVNTTSADITITISRTNTGTAAAPVYKYSMSAQAASDSPLTAGLFKDDTPESAPAHARVWKWKTETDADGNVIASSDSDQTTDGGNPGAALIFSLGNMKNITELPATGGEGILVGLILVALLLAIGGSFIAISRKMHKDRQQAEGVRA